MVSPINGLDGKKKTMLGLIYITAKNDPFGRQHVDSLSAIADMLGIVLPQFIKIFSTNWKNK